MACDIGNITAVKVDKIIRADDILTRMAVAEACLPSICL